MQPWQRRRLSRGQRPDQAARKKAGQRHRRNRKGEGRGGEEERKRKIRRGHGTAGTCAGTNMVPNRSRRLGYAPSRHLQESLGPPLRSPGPKSQKSLKKSGPEKGVITKGVFSLEESLESLKSLNSLEFLENYRTLFCFPQSGDSLKSLESLNSLESLENGLF